MKRTISLAVFLVMLLPAAIASVASGAEGRGAIGGLEGAGTESDPYRIGSYTDLMIVSSYHSYHSGAHYIQTNDVIFDDIVNGNIITMMMSLIGNEVIIELIPDVGDGSGDAFACVSLNDSVMLASWNDGSGIATFDVSVLMSKNSVIVAGSVGGNDFAAAATFSDIDGTMTVTAPLKGNFEPIGTKERPFSGFYDGNGYSIKGIKVVSVGSNDVTAGLFGYTDSATLCNIHIGSDAEHISYVISSSVLNLKNSGTEGRLTLTSGGIAGVADRTTIVASSVDCSVSSFLLMISENEKSSDALTLTVNVKMTSDLFSGGLIGRGNGSVYDSMNTGAVSSLAFLTSRTKYIEGDTEDCALNIVFTANITSYSGGVIGGSGSITIVNTGNTAPIYSSQSCSMEIDNGSDPVLNGKLNLSFDPHMTAVTGGIAGRIGTGDLLNTFNSGDLYVKMRTPYRSIEPGGMNHYRSEGVFVGGSVGIVGMGLNIDRSHNVGTIHADFRPSAFNQNQMTSFGDDERNAYVGDFYYLSTVFSGQYADENIIRLSTSDMSSAGTFAGWDFDRVWIMSDLGYPVLLIRYPLLIVDTSYSFNGVPKYFIDMYHDLDDDGVLSSYTGRTGFTLTLADEYADRDILIYALLGERMIVLEADGDGRYRIPSPLLLDASSGITLYADGLAVRSVPERLGVIAIITIVSLIAAAAVATVLNIISAASVLSMSAKAEAEIRKEEWE